VIHNKTLWAVLSIVVGALQAWDSGVLATNGYVQLLVGAGILLPALSLVASNRWDVLIVSLIVGAVLLTWARFVSPISLNTLHLGLFVPAIYIFFVYRLERLVAEPKRP
jgi:uncharacterized membrane protein YobD (UPF0266 family)